MRDDWDEIKLIDVVDLKSGTTVSKKLEHEFGDIPYLKVADMNLSENEDSVTTSSRYLNKNDIKPNKILPIGTVIFPKRGGAIATNKKRVLKTPACVDLNIMGAIPHDNILSQYLFYYFLSFDLLDISNGSSVPQINNYSFEDLKINLPKDTQEQKRIVAILDEAFEAIDRVRVNVERNIENAEGLFQSKLEEVFSQRREGWEEKILKEACEVKPSKRQVKNKLSDKDSVSFVPMSHLEINKKYFDEESVRPLDEVYKGYTYFEDGDVLLAKITPCFENGKLGIASDLKNGVGFGSSEYIVYRTHDDLLNEYLYYFLNRDRFRRIGESLMGGAVGHQRLQKEFYEDFIISYPELSMQEKIVKDLDSVSYIKSNLVSSYNKKLAALEELKKSILQKAFSGELTANETVAV